MKETNDTGTDSSQGDRVTTSDTMRKNFAALLQDKKSALLSKPRILIITEGVRSHFMASSLSSVLAGTKTHAWMHRSTAAHRKFTFISL